MSPKKLLPISVVIALLLVGWATIEINLWDRLFGKDVSTQNDLVKLIEDIDLELVATTATDHIRGNPTAKVHIIEYADTACSHCKDVQRILNDLIPNYIRSGEVAWVYRHFLTDLDDTRNARVMECVAEYKGDEGFWKTADFLFEEGEKTNQEISAFVEGLGISEMEMSTCIEREDIENHVLEEMNDAIKAGVIGTPYIFIVSENGNIDQIVGLQPQIIIESAIEKAVSGVLE